MADCLDKAFGGGAVTWRRLQPAWELTQAKEWSHHIKIERMSPAS